MAEDRPNIVLLLAQGMRGDATGFGGNPDLSTPNLDVVARQGMVFYAAKSDSSYSLASVLRERDYATVGIGAMSETKDFDQCFTLDDAYRRWLKSERKTDRAAAWARGDEADMPHTFLLSHGAQRSNLDEAHYVTSWMGDQAVRYLRSPATPLYLEIRFTKPAYPYDPPAPWDELYDRNALSIPEDLRGTLDAPDSMNEARLRKVLAYYYAGISLIDHQVGRILATLTARGRSNNVIVFSSDGAASLNGEDSVYVPLLIAGLPGQSRGQVDHDPVSVKHVVDTLHWAAGIDAGEGLQSRMGIR